MPTMQVETEQLLEAALQLPRPELERFLTLLAARSRPRGASVLPPNETILLQKINQGLPSDEEERLRLLIGKRQSGTLAPDEQQEFNRAFRTVGTNRRAKIGTPD
jgi:hypothetical protein